MKQIPCLFQILLLIGCAFPGKHAEIGEAGLATENFFDSFVSVSNEKAASLYASSTEILAFLNPQVPPTSIFPPPSWA